MEQNHLCNFSRGIKRNNSVKSFLTWTSGSGGDVFKDISYLELWPLVCSAEWNHLCNFGRGHYEEQFYEFISNFGQCLRRRHRLKRFIFWSSGGPHVQWSGTNYAI